MSSLSRAEREELLLLLEEQQRRAKLNRYRTMYGGLYGWQREFIGATAEYSQVCLIAANRIGKTWTGTYMDAIHALGDYPADWTGHRFEHAPLIWCLGYSGEKTRDLLQAPIVGRKIDGGFEGGLIPPDRIIGYESMSGTPNALRTLLVRHARRHGTDPVLVVLAGAARAHGRLGGLVPHRRGAARSDDLPAGASAYGNR